MVEASDVIIQVLDARDPLGSRCLDVERMVHKAGGLKRIVLLLNKIGNFHESLFKSPTLKLEIAMCNTFFEFFSRRSFLSKYYWMLLKGIESMLVRHIGLCTVLILST